MSEYYSHAVCQCIFSGVVIGTTIVAWLLSLLVALLSLVDFKNYSVLVVVFFMLPILLDVLGYTSLYRSSKGHNQTTLLKKVSETDSISCSRLVYLSSKMF